MIGGIDKYRMYVDEVGNPDLANTDNPNHRFLSLTGVIISLSVVKDNLHPAFESIKERYFGHHPDEPVIFHRKEMLGGKQPFGSLRDTNVRTRFDGELLDIIKDVPYAVLTVLMDKKEHIERYSTWRYDPYHYCMAILVERFVLFLERNNFQGDVMAESRGGKEDMRLKKSFRKIMNEGTNYIDPSRAGRVLTSKEIKVKSKINNISGLQLADLLAHPSRREILIEKGLSEEKKRSFGDKIIHILQDKYDRDGKRLYGKKILP